MATPKFVARNSLLNAENPLNVKRFEKAVTRFRSDCLKPVLPDTVELKILGQPYKGVKKIHALSDPILAQLSSKLRDKRITNMFFVRTPQGNGEAIGLELELQAGEKQVSQRISALDIGHGIKHVVSEVKRGSTPVNSHVLVANDVETLVTAYRLLQGLK